MKQLLYIFTMLLSGVFLSGCQQKRPDEVDFLLLYTTQMYGNLLSWDFEDDTINDASLSNFSTLVKEQRAIYGDRLIVLDNGNLHTRGLSNIYSQYFDTVSEPLSIRAQRLIGYDAVAIGNGDMRVHELFHCERHDSATCPPVISTNLFNQKTGQHFFRPWICLERAGVRIAVFSLVDEQADFWTPRLAHPDAECHEMVESLRDQILQMRHQCKPDLVIGLVSSSRNIDLQQKISGIDLVINNGDESLSRTQAGKILISMTRDEQTGKYKSSHISVTIDLQQYETDPEYDSYFEKDVQDMRAEYNKNIGSLDDSIYTSYGLCSSHDYYRDILHQAQFWSVKDADVSLANIANPGVVIGSGAVNMVKICQIFNHENILVRVMMKGHELKKILEDFYGQQYNTMTSPNDRLMATLHDAKGHVRWKPNGVPYLNIPPSHFTSAAGMYYTIDLRHKPGDRIKIERFNNGRVFHPDSTYMLISNSYMASLFHTLPSLGWKQDEVKKRLVYDCKMPNMKYVLYKYFNEAPNAYTPSEQQPCDFLPIEWWRQAKARANSIYNPTLKQ